MVGDLLGERRSMLAPRDILLARSARQAERNELEKPKTSVSDLK
jgi:hypothetical protein